MRPAAITTTLALLALPTSTRGLVLGLSMPDIATLDAVGPLAVGLSSVVGAAALGRRKTDTETALRVRESLAAMAPQRKGLFRVGPAGSKGRGLFSRKQIDPNIYLFDYAGEELDERAYKERYPGDTGADYVISTGRGAYMDGADERKSSIARFMNHSRKPNCVCFTMPPTAAAPSRAMIFTSEPVAAGDELVWNYGKGYWRKRPAGSELD